MTKDQLKLIVLVTAGLKAKGYRYVAEIEDGAIVIRIYKGLDES
jgi:hypothetical protein